MIMTMVNIKYNYDRTYYLTFVQNWLFIKSELFLYEYFFLAVHLCKKEIEENIHGDLLNFKVKKSAKAKVDVNKWEFEFLPSDYKLCTSNNSIVML